MFHSSTVIICENKNKQTDDDKTPLKRVMYCSSTLVIII